jgi:pyruvate,water dikinase
VIIPFDQEPTREMVGCKGHNLSRMWRAGLPVPSGFCVPWDGMESLDTSELNCALARLDAASFAVRSSAIQEDSELASFAGILLSRLNVTSAEAVLSVLTEIRNAAVTPAATDYSKRRHVQTAIRVAAIVQTFIRADASGVLFMRDPLTGAGNIVVEAAWGLGVGVVEGLVRPDRWVIAKDGTVISSHIADKDIAIFPAEHGGTAESPVDPACRRRPCLSIESLHELSGLASECEQLFGSPQDIEWAISGGRVWLLQSRPITSTR